MFNAQALVERDADGMYFCVECDEVYTTAGDGYWSEAVKDVRVLGMGMYVCTNEDVGDGDFFITYDEATWDNSKDGLIYTDSAFLANVQDKMRDVLLQMNVDDEVAHTLVADIRYSEQGMQDDGRVSCDAYKLADFLRSYYIRELV